MAIEIIRPRQRVENVSHALSFDLKSDPGCGYRFPCDPSGRPLEAAHEARAEELRASGEYHAPTVETSRNAYVLPATGRCTCGCEVALSDPLNNECERCGRWYNMMGQEKINPHGDLARELDAEGSW